MAATKAPNPDTPSEDTSDGTVVLEIQVAADGVVKVHNRTGGKQSDPALGVIVNEIVEVAAAVGRTVSDLQEEGRLRKSVSWQRREPVRRAVSHVTDMLVGSAWDSAVPADELRTRLQVATDAVDVVLNAGPRQLDALIGSLVPATKEGEDPAQVEARGRLRLQALYRRLIRDSFSVKELAAHGLSRQRLQQLRKEDRIFAVEVPHHKGLLHPRWQFGPDTRPRPEMPDLIAAARDGDLDAIGFHQLMLSADAVNEDGAAPVDLLDDGRVEEVLDIVRAGGG